MWIFLGIITAITLWISGSHIARMNSAKPSPRQKHVVKILYMAPVFSLTSYLSLWFIRSAAILELVQALAESYALDSFLHLIIDLVGSGAQKPGQSENYVDGNDNEALKVLEALPEHKYKAVPPCCCFMGSCIKPEKFNENLLNFSKKCTQQLTYVVPILRFLDLYVDYEDGGSRSPTALLVHQVFQNLEMLSVFIAMWGLIILYHAVHDLLPAHRLTFKFVAIKSIIVLGSVQKVALKLMAGWGWITPAGLFNSPDPTLFWGSGLTVLEALGMSIWLMKAFPAWMLPDIPLEPTSWVQRTGCGRCCLADDDATLPDSLQEDARRISDVMEKGAVGDAVVQAASIEVGGIELQTPLPASGAADEASKVAEMTETINESF